MDKFENANPDVIRKIMEEMHPISILNLCQTNKKFSKICNDQQFFARLLKSKYPEIPRNNQSPKEQFAEIAGRKGLEYIVQTEPYGNKVIDTNGNEIELMEKIGLSAYVNFAEVEDIWDSQFKFAIKGTKLHPTGTKLWLNTRSDWNGVTAMAYTTLEDAVEDFLNDIFEDVFERGLEEYLDNNTNTDLQTLALKELISKYSTHELIEEIKTIPPNLLTKFDDYIAQKHLPTPFSREGFRDYILENRFLNENPTKADPSDVVIWQFVEVTLQDEFDWDQN